MRNSSSIQTFERNEIDFPRRYQSQNLLKSSVITFFIVY